MFGCLDRSSQFAPLTIENYFSIRLAKKPREKMVNLLIHPTTLISDVHTSPFFFETIYFLIIHHTYTRYNEQTEPPSVAILFGSTLFLLLFKDPD